jgi:FMN phosphatase YigB (HAD superfamily)
MADNNIKYLLFDAANTLIHKPLIWERMMEAIGRHGYEVNRDVLKRNHKLLSEILDFPDKTSSEFYRVFNGELLQSLGIIPSDELLDDIFKSCTYLPWEAFEDADFISEVDLPVMVISNFNNGLRDVLKGLFEKPFAHIIVSEEEGIRKPSTDFYALVHRAVDVAPSEILYVGDSLKLDIIPGLKMGWNVRLIDRLRLYDGGKHTISDLRELKAVIASN